MRIKVSVSKLKERNGYFDIGDYIKKEGGFYIPETDTMFLKFKDEQGFDFLKSQQFNFGGRR